MLHTVFETRRWSLLHFEQTNWIELKKNREKKFERNQTFNLKKIITTLLDPSLHSVTL